MHIQRAVGRVGVLVSRVFRAVAPDPIVIAILLLTLTCVLGLTLGTFPAAPGQTLTLTDKLTRLADSFRDTGSGSHMWSLLAFAMQMCLVLVSGHVLASAPVVKRLIERVARLPRTGHGGAALVGFVACAAALINWGLGLIVGALLAREVGRALAGRDIPHHYPIIAAAGYFGLMIWHGGFSGSAPLTMTSAEGTARTLPKDTLAALDKAGFASGVPLDHTLFTPLNAAVSLGLLLIVPMALWFLAPRDPADQVRCTVGDPSADSPHEDDPGEGTLPDRLDRSRIISALLVGALAAGLVRFVDTSSLWRLGLNEIIAGMLAMGLVLHGTPRRFMRATDEAAGACGGIIVQFPIYAAIIAVMVNTGLIAALADLASSAAPWMLPITTFLSACAVNLFVPSGGGQWAVQGPIALQAGLNAGVEPGRMIMAVAYGDQLTNMLQPFWALPLLAITRVRARDIVGYTAIVMLLGGAWIIAALLIL
jgi:short-chain fatty acids transporter